MGRGSDDLPHSPPVEELDVGLGEFLKKLLISQFAHALAAAALLRSNDAEAYARVLQERDKALCDLDAAPIIAGMAADKEKVFGLRPERRNVQPFLPGRSLLSRARPGIAVGVSTAQRRPQMRRNHSAAHQAGTQGSHVFDNLDPSRTVGLTKAAGRTGEERDFFFKAFHTHLSQPLHMANVEALAGLSREQTPWAKVRAQSALHAPVDGLRPHFHDVVPHFKRNAFQFHQSMLLSSPCTGLAPVPARGWQSCPGFPGDDGDRQGTPVRPGPGRIPTPAG